MVDVFVYDACWRSLYAQQSNQRLLLTYENPSDMSGNLVWSQPFLVTNDHSNSNEKSNNSLILVACVPSSPSSSLHSIDRNNQIPWNHLHSKYFKFHWFLSKYTERPLNEEIIWNDKKERKKNPIKINFTADSIKKQTEKKRNNKKSI